MRHALTALGASLLLAALPAHGESLALYCSHDTDACELAAQTFQRDTGITTTVMRKATGEVYAQLRAERAHPRADVWYGGTIEPFLQAASDGLFEAYRSPALAEQRPWAQRATADSGYLVDAIYRIVIGLGSNPALLASRKQKAPACWSDLVRPDYRGEIELSNPVTSGTGYTILATLVTLYGEDEAFAYLRRLAANVVRWTASGTAQGPSVARGEVGVGISFVHEFVVQQLAGFAVDIAIPCEGTGAALGGMALIRDAPHPQQARAFIDWALSRPAMELANRTRNLIIPANVAATLRPEAARYADVKLLDLDPAHFGDPAVRTRLLARWQADIGDRLR